MTNSAVLDIQSSALKMVSRLAIVQRTANIHSTDNSAFIDTADKFIASLNDMIASEHEIAIQLREDIFYINGQRLRYSPRYMLNIDYLAGQFRNVNLGTVIIKNDINLEDTKTFINSFIKTAFSDGSFERLQENMSGISYIELKKPETATHESTPDVRKMVRKTYFNAFYYIKGVIGKIKADEKVDIRSAKRIYSSIVNTIVEHEQIILGMTTMKDYDEYTYYHCTNVSILSVALGHRLGLSRRMLIDLGISSLFHDLGKIEVPYEILNKPSRLVDDEWKVIRKHPAWGVKALLKMRDIDPTTIKSVMVAFEHHMNLNHSGYPRLLNPLETDFFSRIVSIADRFDAMTAVRKYVQVPMSPDKALSTLMEKSTDELDPVLLKYFINLIGLFPIGTLVKLDTNELGLVFENNHHSLFRPRVMLISDTDGNMIKGHVIDLTEKCDEDRYARSITKILNARKYGINIVEYLL